MGILTITAIETGCFGACTNDDVPDQTYDFLVKQKELKDGLELYKPRFQIDNIYKLKCPLCKCNFSEEEKNKLRDIFNKGNEMKLLALIGDYNRELDIVNEIDNIEKLETIYNKIEEMAKIVEANRFYKHTCTKNDICKRTANQDVYIDLCLDSPKDTIAKGMKIDFNRLKTDENYKNNYLNDREILYVKSLLRQKKKEIEDEYRDEFEEMTFKKEQNMYEWSKRNIKDAYQRHLEFEGRKGPMDIKFEFQASNEWYKEKGTFKYSATKKKLLRYIENLTGQTINDNVIMQEREYEEFQQFILKREPDYAELLKI